MPIATYKIEGDEGTLASFFRRNRPSTEGLNVLQQWKLDCPGREFDVLEDTDDFVVVQLTWSDGDSEAGQHVHGLALQHGVRVVFQSQP